MVAIPNGLPQTISLQSATMHEPSIRKLDSLFSQMGSNSQMPGESWRNLKLAAEAYSLLTDHIPLRCAQRITPYTRIRILSSMLEEIDTLSMPRFAIQVRHYQNTMFELIHDAEDREVDMAYDEWHGDPRLYRRPLQSIRDELAYDEKRLQQYADLEIPMSTWCKRYDHLLHFDPAERTFEWEMHIYEVELECHEALQGMGHGRGSCHSYWAAMKKAWKKRGIEWRSPGEMNPGVRFD